MNAGTTPEPSFWIEGTDDGGCRIPYRVRRPASIPLILLTTVGKDDHDIRTHSENKTYYGAIHDEHDAAYFEDESGEWYWVDVADPDAILDAADESWVR